MDSGWLLADSLLRFFYEPDASLSCQEDGAGRKKQGGSPQRPLLTSIILFMPFRHSAPDQLHFLQARFPNIPTTFHCKASFDERK